MTHSHAFRRPLAVIFFLALAAAGCSDKAKEFKEITDACGKSKGDAKVAACTRMIESGHWQGAELAMAYFNRGSAKYAQGDFDGSIADNTRAIELNPTLPYAFAMRGMAKGRKNDYADAIPDFERAMRVDPKYALAYTDRGYAKLATGNPAGALADFDRAIELDPRDGLAYSGRAFVECANGDVEAALTDYNRSIGVDPDSASVLKRRAYVYWLKGDYAHAADDFARAQQLRPDAHVTLWLYLVRARAGADGQQELAANADNLDRTKWPAPVIAFYQGRGTTETLLATAKNANPATEREQLCEANFYLGEYHLTRGDWGRAQPLLRVAAQCPQGSARSSAVAELARFGGGKVR